MGGEEGRKDRGKEGRMEGRKEGRRTSVKLCLNCAIQEYFPLSDPSVHRC